MRILVTGGAGFIGNSFIRYIQKQYPYYEILNYDKLTYAGNTNNLLELNEKNYLFVKGDINDKVLLKKLIFGFDCVINFAAHTHVDRSIKDANPFLDTNIYGVHTLLSVARRLKIPKFIQISTDEVYGSTDLTGCFDENSPLKPTNPYAVSKASADLFCHAFSKTYGVPIIIVRPSNNYGPRQYPEKVIPLFVTNIIEGKKIPLYGKGENIREWTYVEDTCSALDIIMHKGEIGETYNVSSNIETTNYNLALCILDKFNCHPDDRGQCIEFVKDRPGHDFRYSVSSEKVRALGWKHEYSFNKGLSKTVAWYMANKEWWEKIKKRDTDKVSRLYSSTSQTQL